MKPKAPKAPSEEEWDLLIELKPVLEPEHAMAIGDFSSKYLSEYVELSEDPLSNLYLLWKMSKMRKANVSGEDAKEIEKLVLTAFSKAGDVKRGEGKKPAETRKRSFFSIVKRGGELLTTSRHDKIAENLEKLDFLNPEARKRLAEKLEGKRRGVKLSGELVEQASKDIFAERTIFYEFVVPEVLERVEKPKELGAWFQEAAGLHGKDYIRHVMPWVVRHTEGSKKIKTELENFDALNSEVLNQFRAFDYDYRPADYASRQEEIYGIFDRLVESGRIREAGDIGEWGKRIAKLSQVYDGYVYGKENDLSKDKQKLVSHVLSHSATLEEMDAWLGALGGVRKAISERRQKSYRTEVLVPKIPPLVERSTTPGEFGDSFSRVASLFDAAEQERQLYGIPGETVDKFSDWERARELIGKLEGHLGQGVGEKYERFRETKDDKSHYGPWRELSGSYDFGKLVVGGLLRMSGDEKELENLVNYLLEQDPARMVFRIATTKRSGSWDGGKSSYSRPEELMAHCIAASAYYGLAERFGEHFPGLSQYGNDMYGEHPKVEVIPAMENAEVGVLGAVAALTEILESYVEKKERYSKAVAESCRRCFASGMPKSPEAVATTLRADLEKSLSPEEVAILFSGYNVNDALKEPPNDVGGLVGTLERAVEFDMGVMFQGVLSCIPSILKTRTTEEISEAAQRLEKMQVEGNLFTGYEMRMIFEKARAKPFSEVFEKLDDVSRMVLGGEDQDSGRKSIARELVSSFLSSSEYWIFNFTEDVCKDISALTDEIASYDKEGRSEGSWEKRERLKSSIRTMFSYYGPVSGRDIALANLAYLTNARENKKLIQAIELAETINSTGSQYLWGNIMARVRSTEFSVVEEQTSDLARVIRIPEQEGGWSPRYFIGNLFQDKDFNIEELNATAAAIYPLALEITSQEPGTQQRLGRAFSSSLSDYERGSSFLAYFTKTHEEKQLIRALELAALFDSSGNSGLWHALFSKVGSMKFSDVEEKTRPIADLIKSGRSFNANALTEAVSGHSLEIIAKAIDEGIEGKIMSYGPDEREEVRGLFNSLFSNASGVTSTLNVSTLGEAKEVISDTARVLAFTAFKTQATLHRISEETGKPIVAAYILSTGFGLRAPTPSMRQFDNQYLDDQNLLDKAFSERVSSSGTGSVERKIELLKKAFRDEVNAEQKKILGEKSSEEKEEALEVKAARMKAFLSVGSRWMEKGWLKSLVYQTGYKVASGGGGINPTSEEARITDKIGATALPLGCPIVIVDHSTVRTSKHPTVANSQVPDSSMGRAIAQVISRLAQQNPEVGDKVGWVSVINNWNIGETISQIGTPKVIGFNLYAGMEYRSIGGRKEDWLPTDDKPFFVGRSWNTTTSSTSSRLTSIFMDENYKIVKFDSTRDYWDAFREKYLALESQNRMDWARKFSNIILFDVDGTIVDSNGSFKPALRKALEGLSEMLSDAGSQVTVEELEERYQAARKKSKETLYDYGRFRDMEIRLYNILLEVAPKISDDSVISSLRSFAKAAYDIYWGERLNNSSVYQGAADCLAELNSLGYNVILMSDRRDSELHDMLQLDAEMPDGSSRKIGELVKGAIITNDLISEIQTDIPICRLGLPKENEAYSRVSRLLTPGSVELMIGNSRSHDIRPAEKSGIKGVLVKHGHGYEKVMQILGKDS